MDSKLLLVKVITLLYKEGLLKDSSNTSTDIANEIIDSMQLPESAADFDRSREVLVSLRTTAKWLIDGADGTEYDRASLLQRIRVNVAGDNWLYDAFATGMEEVTEEQLRAQVMVARKELREFLGRSKITEIMKKQSHKLIFHPESVPNLREFIANVASSLEPYRMMAEGDEERGNMGEIDFSRPETVQASMVKGQLQTSVEGILKTGWQGINRLTGEHNGFRRGETVVVGALQFNYKTGFTLSLFMQLAMYNTPWMKDPTKKPILLQISLENENEQNILWMYAHLKEMETGRYVDLQSVNLLSEAEQEEYFIEARDYVIAKLTATGYEIRMLRWDPSETTYQKLFDYVDKLEAEGYEIHGIVFDYLTMMSKRGLESSGATGSDIRDLFRRVRAFMSARNILFITPAQLSPAAKQLVRGNVENLVKEVANKGYYDGCSTIDQEVDLEIYIHKVIVNGRSYLTIGRGKHRKIRETPEKDKYLVLPFHDVGAIVDDLFGKDTSLKHAGGGEPGSNDEVPWHVSA